MVAKEVYSELGFKCFLPLWEINQCVTLYKHKSNYQNPKQTQTKLFPLGDCFAKKHEKGLV